MAIAEFSRYVDRSRWQSYYDQLEQVMSLSPSKLLEIGVGHRVLYSVLKSQGLDVTSFDFDPEMKSDVQGDIRTLNQYFEPNSFDAICCFQILEHLPFDDLDRCLEQLSKVTRRYVLISLPYAGISMRMQLGLALYNTRELTLEGRVPFFWIKSKPTGEHQWEPGWREYPISRLESLIKAHFSIKRRHFTRPYKNIVMYILEKK